MGFRTWPKRLGDASALLPWACQGHGEGVGGSREFGYLPVRVQEWILQATGGGPELQMAVITTVRR